MIIGPPPKFHGTRDNLRWSLVLRFVLLGHVAILHHKEAATNP